MSLRRVLPAVALASVLVFAGCSKSDDTSTSGASSTTTPATSAATTPGTTPSAKEIAWDKSIQEQLKAVGCYTGNVDGIVGPQTDAAVLAFQQAAGLTADGEVGPETTAALAKDAKAGKTVCTSGGTTTTAKAGTTTTTVPSVAPCTATALQAAVGAGSINDYVCSQGYAAVQVVPNSGSGQSAYIFKSENGKWVALGQNPCGSASAGLPPSVLEMGCAPTTTSTTN